MDKGDIEKALKERLLKHPDQEVKFTIKLKRDKQYFVK